MNEEKDVVHLWYSPKNGRLLRSDVAFVDRYCKFLYPKQMEELTRQMHRFVCQAGMQYQDSVLDYRLTHFTVKAFNGPGVDRRKKDRFMITETLRVLDNEGKEEFNVSIVPTSQSERSKHSFVVGEKFATRTQSIDGVIRYLEDVTKLEEYKWVELKLNGTHDALPLMTELIAFLKTIVKEARVDEFSVTESEAGRVLRMTILSPGVLSYYTRIDWTMK